MLPLPLAVKPVAPPVAVGRVRGAGERGRQRVGDRGAGHVARAGVGDHDRIGDRRAGRDACLPVGIGDLQIGLRRERVGVGGAVVGRVRIGGSGRSGNAGRVGQRAGGGGADGAIDDVGDRAAGGHVDGVAHVAGAAGREACRTAGGGRRVRGAGERGRQRVGDRGAGYAARAGIGDDERISDGSARRDAGLPVAVR